MVCKFAGQMLKRYLYQPYPLTAENWKTIIYTSLFIAGFMLVLQPFGLSGYHGAHKTYILLGYGLVTFLVLFFNAIVVPRFFKNWFAERNWTVIKQILWLLWIIFTIGIGNYFYTSLLFSAFSNFYNFLIFQYYTLALGIIPIVTFTIVNQNRLLSKNLKAATEFNEQLHNGSGTAPPSQLVYLSSENEKEQYKFDVLNLLYIESNGNYLQVYYINDGYLKNVLLRSSLKRIESLLKDSPDLVKCHRAFIVNTSQIEQVKGNSQGLKLSIKHSDTKIPVSRNFAKNFRQIVNNLN
jgi:DNA-binding LytR/AlgR family response regulator